jgi:DNA-binding response OmpR family regulator
MDLGARILVVEDELPMRTILNDCLESENYRVLLAGNGEEALNKAIREKPDCMVLDVMMPRLDGFSVCKELRRLACDFPILILTAKGRVEDRVIGLDSGADDFLVKPFSRDELLARIRALLRRRKRWSTSRYKLVLGDFEVNFIEQTAHRNGQPVELTLKEFSILKLLADFPGEVVSRDRFLDAVWGYTAFPTTRTVDRHIVSLRAKIGDNPTHPKWLKTV